MSNFTYGVITVSDRCHLGQAVDTSGPSIKQNIQLQFGANKISNSTVPDEQDKIEEILKYYCDDLKLHCIFTTGGTGFAPRDVTPEATRNIIHKECPQLSLAMALESLQKTKFAVLSRSICGIRGTSLIINMPGSKKAVDECFAAIQDVLPHAIELIRDEKSKTEKTHQEIQNCPKHVCPHKTAKEGDVSDRNSIYPMMEVEQALDMIYSKIKKQSEPEEVRSNLNCPPFRASIKDGYAVKSSSIAKNRIVISYVSAGEPVIKTDFPSDYCYKINTGAAIPHFADAVIQIEDTVLIRKDADGNEKEISVLTFPTKKLDIREIGSDLMKGEVMFRTNGLLGVAEKTILASVGQTIETKKPTIAIISTGDELIDPKSNLEEGQIYDCNSTMLKSLLLEHNFDVKVIDIAKDDYNSLKNTVTNALNQCDVVISSGGVSMGDKDYVKRLLIDLGFEICFGRVNMKPGKPMTFAANDAGKLYFALPGNPVSAYVTFQIFVLPALRFMCGVSKPKCPLPVINTILQVDKYQLDSRPEYVRAHITYSLKKGVFYSHMSPNQMSSRVSSLINADVLLHLPGATDKLSIICRGSKLKATIIKQHFISDYKD
ncbi:unnamed protein product [Diamesa hyperborea]